MSILVLGGAGYVGSHTVDHLCDNDYDVVVADNLETGHKEAINNKAKFYQGDIRDKVFLNKVFQEENITDVIHFAAFSIVPESMKDPLKYFDNNVAGMISLLEVMRDFDVKRIIFSSTAATYGEPKQIPIKESDPTDPTNPYGESKLAMEKIMKWSDIAYGIKFVALRYFNVAGAKEDGSIGEDHGPETHLIPIILQVAAGQRDEITIFGDDYDTKDGTNVRDYVHVMDLASAHRLAMEYLIDGNDSKIFNLGSQNGFSNKEILEAARKVTGMDIKSNIGDRRPGDPSTLIADSTNARKILGWQPQNENIEKIIQDAWNFKSKHINGFSS
ncbi:UDP-glucose 4-epimerase GalE [Companilactobacillus metriopterae]|uniref:UDP-glucose 4-epimerase GalE n=1 Tax=Companilactobacillus metriopterae TaxID=1909267 RepID=UPI00100BCC05|nr:UDP-glucose 4-epimerase GalE [Companilactobacillus metriopterae]